MKSGQKLNLPYFVLAAVAIAAIIGLASGIKHSGSADGKPPSKSQDSDVAAITQCLTFHLPSELKVNTDGPLCNVSASSSDQVVNVELLPDDVSAANLQQWAQEDFARQYPRISGDKSTTGRADTFAGRPAYVFEWKDDSNNKILFYIFTDTEKVTVRGMTYSAYAVHFSSKGNDNGLIATVQNSWRWKTVKDDPKNAFAEVPISSADTQCFSLTPPQDGRFYSRDGCTLRITYGNDHAGELSVRPMSEQLDSAKDYAYDWKSRQKDIDIVSEAAVKVGGLDAYKLVYHKAGSRAGPSQKQAIIFVPTGLRYEQVGGTPGFVISASYGNDDTRKTADAMLGSITFLTSQPTNN